MLRIDVHPESEEERYAIPSDNPFADSGSRPIDLFALTEEDFAEFHTDARPEIWLWGLRNPWQFSFDRANGDLYIADVGQNFYEEIHYLPAGQTGGQNLGWDIMEASHCFPISIEYCAKVGLLPVAEYAHEQGCSITGVDVYRGGQFANLEGIYFASDYCSGRVWGLARDDAGQWQFEELLDTRLFVSGSGTDEAGDLYITSCVCGYGTESQPEGVVWRIVPSDQVPEGAETAELETPAETPEADATPDMPE
ncbi:MAG: PQQ-dependent sugar dehydrogenase [Chloroflexi bacterium]|nr:PQQ-dependent sugar dehydrogenase [Chloroflexota bacterium]